jgi:hypothetical protein
MNMFAKNEADSVEEYLLMVPDDRKKEWPIISLAYQKNYTSIYVCTIVEDKDEAEKYKKELGKLSKGVTCIRFKKIEEINLETLKTVLKLAEKKPGVAGAIIVDK